jgi:predicted deacetylase
MQIEPETRGRFHVSVHDVVPSFRRELEVVCREVRALLGSCFSLAITPVWRGESIDPTRDRWLIEEARGAEVLLHGLTHAATGPSGPVGWLTGSMNELGALPHSQAMQRLREGRDRLLALGLSPAGSVAPAWDHGALRPRDLEALGLAFAVSLFTVASTRRRVALATRSWDNDRFGAMALAGEALGAAVEWVSPWKTTPHVVLHPLDTRRGWLSRGIACIARMLDRGLEPGTLGQIVSVGTC